MKKNPNLKDLVTYTSADQTVIDRINPDTRTTGGYGVTNGMRLGAPASRWSTVEGLRWQIDHFVEDAGILYYFAIQHGICTIRSTVYWKSLEGHELEFWL